MPGCGCLFVLGGLAFPRFALFLMWLFDLWDDRLSVAMPNFVVGFLGFLFLPFTTLFYALAYDPVDGVTGFGWIIVALGVLFDIGSYGSSEQARRQRIASV
jgi:hypothetical protein